MVLSGRPLPAPVQQAIVDASMSYSTLQAGELELTIQDSPDGALVNGGTIRLGQPVDYDTYRMVCRTVEIAGGKTGPVVTVRARPTVVAALKGQKGKRSWGTMSIGGWVDAQVRQAGGRAIVQPGLGSESIVRGEQQSTMDLLSELATQAGVWCWETDQTVYFVRPAWWAGQPAARQWPIDWAGHGDYSDPLAGMPEYRASVDGDPGSRESLTVDMIGDGVDAVRPGHVIVYGGQVGAAVGEWIVTGVDLPLDVAEPVTVTCGRPIDPIPEGA